MTGPEHFRQAERLIAQAGEWMDADWGWKGNLSAEERLARRQADLAEAQVHATLAHAAATALAEGGAGGMPLRDVEAWHAAASSEGAA